MTEELLDPYTFGQEQSCFGCGPHNPRGWRLRFFRDRDTVFTKLTPSQGEDGPPGIFHGGLQSTLADEVGGWTLVGLRGKMGLTTSLRIRYLRPVRLNKEVTATGRIKSECGQSISVGVKLSQDNKTCALSTMSFRLLSAAHASVVLDTEIPAAWSHLLTNEGNS
jgi:uncharacterized protein (TIGR00369 family)